MLHQGFTGLEKHRLFSSRDVEETQARIADVMRQEHRLRPVDRMSAYRAHMDYVRLPAMGVGTISFGRMNLHLEQLADYYLMIYCREGRASFVSGGEELIADRSHIACFAPGESLRGQFSEDCEQVIFRVDAEAMRRYTGRSNPRLRRQIDLNLPQIRPWYGFVSSLFNTSEMVDLLTADKRISADCESLFFSLAMSCGILVNEPVRSMIAPMAVKRAMTFIDAHYADPLSLYDIACAVRVPVRTLLASFQRFRGQSPMRYLRDHRLEAARVALQNAREGDTVLAIALGAGFSHPGRFAAEYFQKFGEKPSATIHRGT